MGEGRRPQALGGRAPAALRQPSHTVPPQHTAPIPGAGTRVGLESGPMTLRTRTRGGSEKRGTQTLGEHFKFQEDGVLLTPPHPARVGKLSLWASEQGQCMCLTESTRTPELRASSKWGLPAPRRGSPRDPAPLWASTDGPAGGGARLPPFSPAHWLGVSMTGRDPQSGEHREGGQLAHQGPSG